MYSERFQILLSPEQRKRLEDEARRTGSSISALVREAVDARFGGVTREQRKAAAERIASGTAEFIPPDELEELLDSRYDEEYADLIEKQSRD